MHDLHTIALSSRQQVDSIAGDLHQWGKKVERFTRFSIAMLGILSIVSDSQQWWIMVWNDKSWFVDNNDTDYAVEVANAYMDPEIVINRKIQQGWRGKFEAHPSVQVMRLNFRSSLYASGHSRVQWLAGCSNKATLSSYV